MTQILIIEDEVRIAHWVKKYFERAGFSAEAVHDGREGLRLASQLNPDLIVLDLMLPGIDGIEICRQIRNSSDVPIIMLTAKGTQPDRINGLEIGADDYIVKPFDPQEVVARAKAVLRRTKGQVVKKEQLGPLTINHDAQAITLNETGINLSQAQFALLTTFVRHKNQVLSRDQLIELAFKNQFDGFDRAIDTHIKRLRKLLHTEEFKPIETVYGAGYKFNWGEDA